MVKPKLNFRQLNTAELIQYAEQILTKMQQQTDVFVVTTPSFETVENSIADFRAAAAEAAFHDSRAIEVRKQRRVVLEQHIRELAKYVDTVAVGDRALIFSAGFVPSKESIPSTEFSRLPEGFNVMPDRVGTGLAHLEVDPWPGARLYQFEYRPLGDTEWNRVLTSKRKITLENLQTFTQYEFRVTYLSRQPVIYYSKILTSYVV